ncbi:MAG TPA: DinB family protein [Vicinamibacterales bacterium]|nr:DinB family protein [Vicinamibacterales bacterium]
MSGRYDFLVETYRTERLKIVGVWAQIPENRMRFRPEPRARSPLEHMVHQCMSENNWMRDMLGITVSPPPLPSRETREAFIEHYERCSAERLQALEQKSDDWFEQPATFFDVERSRAWVMTRRIAHSAHHRGQLTVYLRLWGQPLYSTYGPTADTGGLAVNGARVIYAGEPLPVKSEKPVSERPD